MYLIIKNEKPLKTNFTPNRFFYKFIFPYQMHRGQLFKNRARKLIYITFRSYILIHICYASRLINSWAIMDKCINLVESYHIVNINRHMGYILKSK